MPALRRCLSYFGFIHGSHLAINASPAVTFGYGIVTLLFIYLAQQQFKADGRLDWSPIDSDSE